MNKQDYEASYYKCLYEESKFWSLAILNKYCTGPQRYLMENEEQARKAFTQLSELVTRDRAYDINDKKYTYTFDSALGGAVTVDLREVSSVVINPPYHDRLFSEK